MKKSTTIPYAGLAALIGLSLSGCSYFNMDNVLPDKQVEYKREQMTGRHLEVPPDLTSDRLQNRLSGGDTGTGLATSYSEYKGMKAGLGGGAGGASGVLPEIKGIKMMKSGDERWLVIDTPAEGVWPKVLDFWQENGILIVEQDASTGTMRTDWLENTSAVKTDMITSALRSVFYGLYDSNLRDKYRVRLERTDAGGTELYLTHFGMEQEIVTKASGGSEQFVWNARPRDPQLEAEILRQMMIYFGMAETEASALAKASDNKPAGTPRSDLQKTAEGISLVIHDDFQNAWRLSGLALDRVGFAVEDRDRSAGIYYVRYKDPVDGEKGGGWFSSLAFWKDAEVDKVNQYQVQLKREQDQVRAVVADEKGQRVNSATAERILTLMQEQIK